MVRWRRRCGRWRCRAGAGAGLQEALQLALSLPCRGQQGLARWRLRAAVVLPRELCGRQVVMLGQAVREQLLHRGWLLPEPGSEEGQGDGALQVGVQVVVQVEGFVRLVGGQPGAGPGCVRGASRAGHDGRGSPAGGAARDSGEGFGQEAGAGAAQWWRQAWLVQARAARAAWRPGFCALARCWDVLHHGGPGCAECAEW